MKSALIRAARTYAQTFIGLLLAGWTDFANAGDFVDLASAAAVAAVPAGLSLIMNALEDNTSTFGNVPKG